MNTTEVENFPGFTDGIMGPELMTNIRAQSERFGAELVPDDVVALDLAGPGLTVQTLDGEWTADAVILAMGSGHKKLGLTRENELSGHGVSSCATFDGFFFRGMDIAVVGGGDTALEEATFPTRFAESVTVVHRRDTLRASRIMVDRAGDERDLVIGGRFIAIGHEPRSELVKDQVELDDEGYILTTTGTRTDLDGVFSAGDIVDHTYRQAITAAGSGCQAALDAERHLARLAHGGGQATTDAEHTAALGR